MTKRRFQSRFGFSLIEVIAVVAVLGIIASVAAVNLSRSRQRVAEGKLTQDVSTVNRAIQVYEANGGNVNAWTSAFGKSPQLIIEQLKTVAEDADTMTGLSGRMIDLRLEALLQSEDEAKTKRPRALWDAGARRFAIARGGERGIKEFVMNDALAASSVADATEKRVNSMRFAKTDLWVWDYTDRSTAPQTPPTSVDLNPGAGPTPPGKPPGFKVLDPPKFSFKGGSYALKDYDLPLKLSNPNSGAVSVLAYSTTHGVWNLYDGTPILVPPGMTVTAFAKPTHPDWLASSLEAQSYSADPVKLEIEVLAPAAVTYAEAGGAMTPGAIDFPPGPVALIALANADEIPLPLQSSGHFNIFWTYDGGDPLKPGDAEIDAQLTGGLAPGLHMGDPFGGAFPGQPVSYEIELWGTATKLPIKAVARSYSEHLVDSKVAKGDIGISPMPLREPKILAAGGFVNLQLVTAFGDMPQGARIFFTTDGKDPKMKGGKPDGTTIEFTGPFGQSRDLCFPAEIRARVFGPAGFESWFEASPVASFEVPATVDGGDPFFSQVCKAQSLCGYAWFVLSGDASISGSGSQVNGDVALGAGGVISKGREQVKGSVIHNQPGAGNPSAGPGNNNAGGEAGGGKEQYEDLSAAVEDALSISLGLSELEPTQVFDTLGGGTITSAGPGAVNVISVGAIVLNGGATLTLTGGKDDWFVVNVTREFKITGGSVIVSSKGLDPSKVIFNVGPGVGEFHFSGGSAVFPGTILAPTSDVHLSGGTEIAGSLISGGSNQTMSGGATIEGKSHFGHCK